MYSERLEGFIEAIIADGEISDKERQILHRIASEEGVDIDEIDILVDGRLAKMLRENSQRANAQAQEQARLQAEAEARAQAMRQASMSRPQSSKYGQVNKCPNCGAVVEVGSPQCKECGHYFTGVEAVSSVQRFAEMINRIEAESASKSGGLGSVLSGIGSFWGYDSRSQRLCSAIETYPIPTSKEDLLEFLVYLKPKSKGLTPASTMGDKKIADAYKSKYKECVRKAKAYFKDDPQLMELIKEDKGFFRGLFK